MHREPFERLPTEIIIQILHYFDDIVRQDDLGSFFPRIDSVVRSNSCFLFRELISGPKITLDHTRDQKAHLWNSEHPRFVNQVSKSR
ncbi:hypothetical protein BJX68DRAFT_47850 [Aspergillus pseudodeflectus]|uniref:F-box domain-containing protein n=1 Tax=Aspergillus pseudodeflectus TaxID=176178 RepID=A0ABR4KLR8_9EURO